MTVWGLDGAVQQAAFAGVGHGVAFSPGGRLLAAGGADLGIRLWERPGAGGRWRELGVLHGHTRLPVGLAFSRDGRRLVSVADGLDDEPCEVKTWDPARGEEQPFQGPPGPMWSLALAGDGSTLAWTDTAGQVVHLWDVAAGRERMACDWGLGPLRALAVGPDGMTAAAAGQSLGVLVWDIDPLDR
jgi:WD40 repeat protein